MKLLEGKIAIVTGAARGIGEGIVLKFAEHGANIAFTYISESSEEKAVMLEQKLVSLGVKAKAYKSNAGDYSQCEALVNDVIKEFGTIDICVNNAGISKDNLLLRMTPDQWNDVININLNSVFYMTKQVIKPMMKARSGSIINMSSVGGLGPYPTSAPYGAAKAGITSLTKTLAVEWAQYNIRVNSIAPGLIPTPGSDDIAQKISGQREAQLKCIPLGRFGKPEDIVGIAIFLASNASAYVTGETIVVNGGLTSTVFNEVSRE